MPPIYDYHCSKCDTDFEVVQPIKEYTGKGECPSCGNVSNERIFSHQVYFVGASVQHAEYNPAFGKVVKNKKERDELAKRHGLIEIGNEKTETVHKVAENTLKEKLKKSWDEV